MKFGMNTLLWSIELNDSVMPIIEKLQKMGFDGIEVPIFDYDVKKYEKFAKRLDDLGLGRTAVTCRGAEDNPIDPDPKSAPRAWPIAAARSTVARPWA